uniref:Uncharacterized protein n=1 Tax=Candidatus Kentrum eta TaxID=2126337 RepID=A0A450V1H9_9GAMM|nr:MAG: hypothetical protein BECKH772A_GA0070896_101387 [Candidatus Kentron sp. H]VFJ98657.1 MAG: hypothetical protein BECKH772B_GA0070898_101396 [Candidatus Kentron sp. H]VFK03571.1 MAG: hypothetical protein BECKH772C_GA0070978_101356 [Candidatus Kentron sp. H]
MQRVNNSSSYIWNSPVDLVSSLLAETISEHLGIKEHVAAVFGGSSNSVPHMIVSNALDIAAQRTDVKRLQFLHVTEEENLRNSFDLTLHYAEMKVGEIDTDFENICDYIANSSRKCNSWIDVEK